MTVRDVPVTSVDSDASLIRHEQEMPLTPEQLAFAEVIGREIARFWKQALEQAAPGCPPK
jgi:predicted protein tyrosine phosphatase